MAGKYLLVTLGCKVNQYESQQVREYLESSGLRPAASGETADIAVVNTCAVTAEAFRKSRQAIRRVSRGGHTPVVVVGCGAEADAAGLCRLPGVVAVMGHSADVHSELRTLLSHREGHEPMPSVADAGRIDSTTEKRPGASGNEVWIMPDARPLGSSAPAPGITDLFDVTARTDIVKTGPPLTTRIKSFAGHQRAFLKVQDGCDASCSYCLVPRLRSQLRSKPIDVATAETRDLVLAGHLEVVVTGVFLGAYGRNTVLRRRWKRSSSPSPLVELVDTLAGVDGLARLRLSSLEPGDVSEALLDVLSSHRTCVPHLHLPLQSGSATILRRMNRQYGPDQYVGTIERVRKALDRPAISTDIIVGFPGETEDDFDATLAIARQAEFCRIHAFPFSPRDRTAAARWGSEFTPRDVVRDRLRRLNELERETSLSFRRRFLGEIERVIVEERPASADASTPRCPVRVGRADRYFEIHFEGDDVRSGDLLPVRIDLVTPTETHGTLLQPDS